MLTRTDRLANQSRLLGRICPLMLVVTLSVMRLNYCGCLNMAVRC
jgi:hypothetical protein